MKKRLIIFSLLLISFMAVRAQKIDISLPQAANKEYAFILNKGIRQDTIQQGKLSFVGATTINIPEKYKDYAGMGALLLKDAPSLNMIVNQESFSVDQGSDNQYNFKNSPENEYLYAIIQRTDLPAVEDTTLYAPHFIELLRYMMQLNKGMQQGYRNLSEKVNVRLYASNELDMERLYTSGIWYNVVDGIAKLTSDQQMLGEDIISIMKRIKSQEVFEHFANNVLVMTDQYGWDDTFDIIVPYIQESGRIAVPTGQIFAAFSLAKIKKGELSPPIEGLTKPLDAINDGKTLIVFYQPDCDNCKVQMDQLLKDYPKLEQYGVRVVSISADYDKESFEADVKHFPWVDKLCDFKGFAGKNFVNYGIMGTPTFFLLDEDQKVIKRYSKITDVIAKIEDSKGKIG